MRVKEVSLHALLQFTKRAKNSPFFFGFHEAVMNMALVLVKEYSLLHRFSLEVVGEVEGSTIARLKRFPCP